MYCRSSSRSSIIGSSLDLIKLVSLEQQKQKNFNSLNTRLIKAHHLIFCFILDLDLILFKLLIHYMYCSTALKYVEPTLSLKIIQHLNLAVAICKHLATWQEVIRAVIKYGFLYLHVFSILHL